jgi:hypothetical protein
VVQALTGIATGAYCTVAVLVASAGDQAVTLGVAAIGAVASVATAWISTRARQEARGRRVVVTKHGDGDSVTISNDELDRLEGR